MAIEFVLLLAFGMILAFGNPSQIQSQNLSGKKKVVVDIQGTFYEGATMTFTIPFIDINGDPLAPLELQYEVHDEDTGNLLLDTVTIPTPAATYTLVLASAVMIIVDPTDGYDEELHTLTLAWTYSGGGVGTGKLTFPVRELRFWPF